jgi:hypothetical protein
MRYVAIFLFRTLKACIYKNKKLELNLRVISHVGSIAYLNFDADSEYVYRFYLSLPNGVVPTSNLARLSQDYPYRIINHLKIFKKRVEQKFK